MNGLYLFSADRWFLQIKKRDTQNEHLREAPPRFELGIRVLQTHALPLGYSAIYRINDIKRADYEARTRYLHLGKVALYQMS